MKLISIKQAVKEHFMLHPTEKLRVRQMERLLKLPLPSVIRYSKELEKEGILQSTVIAGVNLYLADRNSKRFLLEKKLFNLRSLFESGFVEFMTNECSNPNMVVFGSYARGEDVETSDIDVYVEMPNKELNLEEYERKLSRKIQLFAYRRITDVKNKELANNMLNGIVLNGFVEVLR